MKAVLNCEREIVLKKNCSLFQASSSQVWGGKEGWGKPLTGMKRHYNGLAAAFIIIHACHNMYIFASDGNPSITRGLSNHDGGTTVVGGARKSLCDVASGSLQPLRGRKNLHSIPFCPPQVPHRGGTENT